MSRYSLTLSSAELTSPTASNPFLSHADTTTTCTLVYVAGTYSHTAAPPIEWTPPRVERRFDEERATGSRRRRGFPATGVLVYGEARSTRRERFGRAIP